MAAHVRDRLKLRGADFTTPDSELNLDALFDMRAYLGDQADAVTISDTSGYGPALTVTSSVETGLDDEDVIMIDAPQHPELKVNWSSDNDQLVEAPWYECLGTLNGVIPIAAVPDWGSSINAISESFARQNKLRVRYTFPETIDLLGGNTAESIGRVFACFRFKGEKRGYWREFHVLRQSLCDVVLGKSFLAETQTLTKFRRRISERLRLCIRKHSRLFLMDESHGDLIRCTVNGAAAAALPDTGSDLMIVSGDFARRNRFEIVSEEQHRQPVQLIDGSTVWTTGMVLGANLGFDLPCEDLDSVDHDKYLEFAMEWSSPQGQRNGDEATKMVFVCDLHVIEDLPVDIILSGEFIFKNQVFCKFQHLFMTTTKDKSLGEVASSRKHALFIRKKQLKRWLSGRTKKKTETAVPLVDTWQQRWMTEESRRHDADLWRQALPEAQRAEALAEENQRRTAWDRENPRP